MCLVCGSRGDEEAGAKDARTAERRRLVSAFESGVWAAQASGYVVKWPSAGYGMCDGSMAYIGVLTATKAFLYVCPAIQLLTKC